MWLFLLAITINIGMLVYAWRHRAQPMGAEFLRVMGLAMIWLVGFALETALIQYEAKLLVSRVEFIGIAALPVAWLLLADAYTGHRLPRRVKLLLWVIPIITNVVIWTNPLHHWFYGTPVLRTDLAPFAVLQMNYNWGFYVHAGISYLLMAGAVLQMVQFLVKVGTPYRRQGGLLLLAILLPTLTDTAYVLGYSPVKYYNYTTVVFSISGVILVYALFKYRFLELLPIARDTVINNMKEGIIVLDHSDRLVEINPAGARISGMSTAGVIGKSVFELDTPFFHSLAGMIRDRQVNDSLESPGPDGKFYEVNLSPVFMRGERIGWVVTMYDITLHIHEVREAQRLSNQDSLTGIFNRRYFIEAARQVLSSTRSDPDYPLAVVMMDGDTFKQVNDLYGHATGDQVLIGMTRAIRGQLRKNDLFGRVGGDELAILLNGVPAANIGAVVERLRRAVDSVAHVGPNGPIHQTACFGVVCTNDIPVEQREIETMLALADQALYQAKAAGPNRVEVYAPPHDANML